MKIYEQRDKYKKKVHCRICGNEGHLWTTCPVPKKMIELKNQNKEPDISLYSSYFQNMYNKRDPSGRLHYELHIFANMARYLQQQEKRNEKMKARRDARNKQANKKRVLSCGFCGGRGHNRRNCTVMQDFVRDLSRANQNYRKTFYNKIVQEMGIAEGAVVQVEAKHLFINNKWKENWGGVGMITKIDWNSINLGLAQNNWEWKTCFEIEVLVAGDTIKVDTPMKKFIEDERFSKGLIFELFGGAQHGWSPMISEIIAPSQNLPTVEWFNNGYEECWTWLTKKYNVGQLSNTLTPAIARWHPSRTGRYAPELKKRLKTYGGYNG